MANLGPCLPFGMRPWRPVEGEARFAGATKKELSFPRKRESRMANLGPCLPFGMRPWRPVEGEARFAGATNKEMSFPRKRESRMANLGTCLPFGMRPWRPVEGEARFAGATGLCASALYFGLRSGRVSGKRPGPAGRRIQKVLPLSIWLSTVIEP